MRKILKRLIISVLVLVFIILAFMMIIPKVVPQFGGHASGKRLERIKESPHYKKGRFQNLVKTPMYAENTSMWQNMVKFFKGSENREPDGTIETKAFDKEQLSGNEFSVTWFGHSTVLLQVSGLHFLIDPVFSNHVSPFAFMGPKAFPYSQRYHIADLPKIDAVLITHDHYDHLDYHTIKQLRSINTSFFVPLGLGAHLEKWGVEAKDIIEAEWWDEIQINDEILLACVPMRHFSGRGIADRNKTLWAGWVVKTEKHTIIHTGDSGYGAHFKQIGEKYGPFDLTMVECGQYNEGWPYIHMSPEETVQAHIDLNGRYLLPIHWGRFNLSLHEWTDPAVRVLKSSKEKEVDLVMPLPGKIVNFKKPLTFRQWWE